MCALGVSICCSTTQAYGIVWKALDRKTNQPVALKKIFDAFQNATDAQRTYREIVFLRELGRHENIIHLIEVMKADNDKDIYLVFEYMGTQKKKGNNFILCLISPESDLHAVIRANILKDVHKSYLLSYFIRDYGFPVSHDFASRSPSGIFDHAGMSSTKF